MARVYTWIGQTTVGSGALLAVASCVQPPVREAARAEQAIRDAQPLLRKLQLEVPAATMSPDLVVTAPYSSGYAAPPFVAQAQSEDDARRAEECLTAAVYYEARSESEDGQRAVAQVVLNRVRDRAFPASVCGVVYQGSQRRTGCQFSFTCDGSMLRPRQPAAWERSRRIAAEALAGSVYAPVGSATHYHANYVSPWWAPSLHRITSVGSHIFYRWSGALERALTFRQRYAGTEPGAAVAAPIVARVELEGGEAVTVHRGSAEGDARPVRTLIAGGVNIHLNREGDRDAASRWSGAYAIDGATIGEESDPT